MNKYNLQVCSLNQFVKDRNDLEFSDCFSYFNKDLNSKYFFLEYKDFSSSEVSLILDILNKYKYENKTFIINVKTLENIELFIKIFKNTVLFVELWDKISSLNKITNYFKDDILLLPVSCKQTNKIKHSPFKKNHNNNFYLSLGNDTDIDLIKELVKNNQNIKFYAPNNTIVSFKNTSILNDFNYFSPNLKIVPGLCNGVMTKELVNVINLCDTVIIPVKKKFVMRGGLRFADAIYGGKKIIATTNFPIALLMGKIGLMVENKINDLQIAINKINNYNYQINEQLYKIFQYLVIKEQKLHFMLNYSINFNETQKQKYKHFLQLNKKQLEAICLLEKKHGNETVDYLENVNINKNNILFHNLNTYLHEFNSRFNCNLSIWEIIIKNYPYKLIDFETKDNFYKITILVYNNSFTFYIYWEKPSNFYLQNKGYYLSFSGKSITKDIDLFLREFIKIIG